VGDKLTAVKGSRKRKEYMVKVGLMDKLDRVDERRGTLLPIFTAPL
jgi:hypothetical protein